MTYIHVLTEFQFGGDKVVVIGNSRTDKMD